MDNIEEKAREIVVRMQFQNPPLEFEQAKKCALITVNEILKNIDSKHNGYYTMPDDEKKNYDFWDSVEEFILDSL